MSFAERLSQALSARRKSPADLSRGIGASESAVSQWLNGQVKSMRGPNLMAAATFLRCNPDWLASGKGISGLDEMNATLARVQASFSGVTGAPAPIAQGRHGEPLQDVVIPQYEAGGAMGHGLVLEAEPPGIIRSWNVSSEWLRRNIPYCSSYANLAIVTGFGNSMVPLYAAGDPLICDLGHTLVDADGVYFFRIDDHGYIKMLQRLPTATGTILRARSKNPDYEPFDITPDMADRFQVFGRILKAWKGELL